MPIDKCLRGEMAGLNGHRHGLGGEENRTHSYLVYSFVERCTGIDLVFLCIIAGVVRTQAGVGHVRVLPETRSAGGCRRHGGIEGGFK